MADSNVPPVFSIIDDQIEILPVESVIAVFEVKRTLNETSFKAANDKLKKAWDLFSRNGRTTSGPTNQAVTGSLMPGTQSPILGVLSLAHDEIKTNNLEFSVIDLAWSVSGWATVAANQDGKISPTVSREGHASTKPLMVTGSQAVTTQKMIAILRSWLATSTGQWLKTEGIFEYYIDRW